MDRISSKQLHNKQRYDYQSSTERQTDFPQIKGEESDADSDSVKTGNRINSRKRQTSIRTRKSHKIRKGLAEADVAAIERALEIKNEDCVTSNHGCNGGYIDNAFQYIIKNKAVTAESSYPYEGSDGTCNQQKATDTAAQITSYKDVTSNNEHELKIAVHQQPVSIAISVVQEFKDYGGGIFN
ncbi:hypothetical protein Dsin_021019 [Dipteronia sinensis]|uniref:Peptidase C1A papain C-terminal domain-containing protein n=1 Tax=Dipteronia sinensis TaxID=43782 RepID=A0AAE0ABJ1_9ROSI|nr:hypothetical protein Dsin_021019 [Dipteronia sinensis]